jgi:hypothetical protein
MDKMETTLILTLTGSASPSFSVTEATVTVCGRGPLEIATYEIKKDGYCSSKEEIRSLDSVGLCRGGGLC